MSDTPPLARLRVPTEALVRLQQHHDDLLHELRLLAVADRAGVSDLAAELRAVIERHLQELESARQAARSQADEAARVGATTADIEVPVSREVVERLCEAVDAFEDIDRLCNTEQLLTLPTPPDLAQLRRWCCEEIVAQVRDGRPPTSFDPDVVSNDSGG